MKFPIAAVLLIPSVLGAAIAAPVETRDVEVVSPSTPPSFTTLTFLSPHPSPHPSPLSTTTTTI